MKKPLITTLVAAASLLTAITGFSQQTADEYWAARGWYREDGATVYHRGYNTQTKIILDILEEREAHRSEYRAPKQSEYDRLVESHSLANPLLFRRY